jgi:cytochrome c
MRNKWFLVLLVGGLMLSLCLTSTSLFAEDAKAPEVKAPADDPAKEALAKETEDACAASAKDKPTPEMIIKKIDEACKLLEKEGKASFPKFKGKDSQFIFAGTYIWIHDMEGVMQMHPVKYKMEGKHLIGLKDINGKLFFTEMNKIAREKGSGWVAYMWPKPGEKDPSKKVSYVKLCKIDGVDMVAGCGVYDLSDEVVKKLVGAEK